MPAALARLALASLRPSSEVMTVSPRSTRRAPTPAPMAPCATTATVGFIVTFLICPGTIITIARTMRETP